MPLMKQLLEIPFGAGVDTYTDEKLVLPTKLTALENARFDKRGRIAKRFGVDDFQPNPGSSARPNSGMLYADAERLFVRAATTANRGRVNHVGRSGDQTQAQYSPVFSRLVGGILSVAGSQSSSSVDAALDTNGKRVGMAMSVEAGVGWSRFLFDYESKRPIVQTASVYAPALNGRVLALPTADQFITGLYDNTGQLFINHGLRNSGSGIIQTGSFTLSSLHIAGRWDWAIDGTSLFIVYLDVAGTTCTIAKYDTTTFAAPTTATFAVAGVTALTCCLMSAGTVGVFWATASGVSYRGYTKSSMALAFGTTVIHNVAGTYELLAATQMGSTSSAMLLIQESVAPTATYNRQILFGPVTDAGVATFGVSAKLIRGVGIASKPGQLSSAWASTYDTPTQRTLFFHQMNDLSGSSSWDLLGRIFYGRHGGLQTQHCVAQAIDISDDGFAYDIFCAAPVQRESVATAAATAGSYAPGWAQGQHVGGTVVNGGMRAHPNALVDGELLFGGGYLHSFTPLQNSSGTTGPMAVPNGFLLSPELVSVTPQAAGGSMADGTYGVICTYEYVDHRGRVFESGPSAPLFATIAGSGGAGRLTVVVQNHRTDQYRTVYIVFYRTLPSSGIYFRERRVLNLVTANSTTQDLTISNTLVDDVAQLYCGIGGEMENAQPDAPIAICADKDRAWIVAGSEPARVRPSKPLNGGDGLAFFPDMYRQIGAGEITALSRQDGKLYAFQRDQVHRAAGDGPDALGFSDTLSDFTLAFPNVGAERHDAVLPSAIGIYAKSDKDIWLIGRDMQLVRIGAEVENWTSTSRFNGAAYDVDARQARWIFGVEGGTCFELVFSEDEQAWSYNPRPSSTTYAMPSIARFDGAMYYILPSGSATEIYREGTGFTDNGAGYALLVRTAWIKPGQAVQGYGRAYWAKLIGELKSTHTLQVRIRYDYQSTWAETHTISSANAVGADGVWQPEFSFNTGSACEAFQVEISETSPTGESFNLAGMLVEIGIKPGRFKGRTSKRF